MKWDEVRNRWNQLKGDVKKTWEKLTDEDIEQIAGDRAELERRLCRYYNIDAGRAREQVDAWKRRRPQS
ncbi:CsbD family protein [Roseobacter ponti]|uniref:CsbD family protein n=1 Tax=Roseobacter ponti TaxID=1891787 RepID=A0A858SMC9_9RHOB|nr:CsbD family protein [Roseobacter ponti]QJF49670.1 CsbD family protein [Roseobacter ponti]